MAAFWRLTRAGLRTGWLLTRAQVHPGWLLQPALCGALLAWVLYWTRHAPHRVEAMYSLFEFLLPLAAAFYLAGLPAWEREQGAAETHLSCPQWPSVRLLLAALPRAAAWGLTALACGLAVEFAYLPGRLGHLAYVTAAPTLALTGVGLLGTALLRNQAGGLIATGLWWLWDLLDRLPLNDTARLFRVTMGPGLGLDLAVQTRNLCLIGVAGWLLTIWLAHRRSWWVR